MDHRPPLLEKPISPELDREVPLIKADFKKYFIVFLISTVLLAIPFSLGLSIYQKLSCNVSGLRDGYFLAYCTNPHYGDYEHSAYYYGLEPGMRQHVQEADILFLGSSAAQTAFSAEVLRKTLQSQNIRYYLLGFGYVEHVTFPFELMRWWDLHPKILVISADPFFQPDLSLPAQEVLSERLSAKLRAQYYHWLGGFLRVVCDILPLACSNKDTSIVRSIDDGHWEWHLSYPPERTAIDLTDRFKVSDAEIQQYREEAKKFLTIAAVRPKCVVFTAMPRGKLDTTDMASRIGQDLGVRVIVPKIDQMTSFDNGSHFTAESASRWSAAFVEALQPIIKECL